MKNENLPARAGIVRDLITRLEDPSEFVDHVDEAIAALEDYIKLIVESSWQPIDTLPIDTPVILYFPSLGIHIGRFEYMLSHKELSTGHYYKATGGWAFNIANRVDYVNEQPTHWMPVPDRPDTK